MSLFLDGITGGVQDKLRAEHRSPTHCMMLWMNVWSVLYLGVGKLVCQAVYVCVCVCVFLLAAKVISTINLFSQPAQVMPLSSTTALITKDIDHSLQLSREKTSHFRTVQVLDASSSYKWNKLHI